MTYAELIQRTLAYGADQGDRHLRDLRWAINKFFELANLEPSMECDDQFLTNDYIQLLRARAERDGKLHKGGSSPWASRMKHVVRMRRDLRDLEKGTTFAEMLTDGLTKAELTHKELGRRIGVTPNTITNWCSGSYLPSEPRRATIAEIDKMLGLSGRLVASLNGVILATHSLKKQYEFTPDDKIALKAGKGSLRHLVRFWSKERGVTVSGILKTVKCRGTLINFFPASDQAATLRASDRPVFDLVDQRLNVAGKILAAFDRELASQKPQIRLRFSYSSWPPQLRREFSLLEAYKFDNPKGLERTVAGRWTSSKHPDGSHRSASRDAARGLLEYLFGHALAVGLVNSPADLRLAHAIEPEILIGFLRARMKRMNRTYFTPGETNPVRFVLALIYGGGQDGNPGLGYFANDEVGSQYWSDPFFAQRLPQEIVVVAQGGYRIQSGKYVIPEHDMRARWQAYLAHVWRTLRKFVISTPIKSTRKYSRSIADILADPDYDIGKWLKGGFEHLVTHSPARGSSPRAWARHVRMCVLFMALSTRGFRRSTLLKMELCHIVLNERTKKYHFAIPEEMFKQRGKGGSKGGVEAEVDDVLVPFEFSREPLIPSAATELLNLYLKDARPLLKISGNSLFGFNCGASLYEAVRTMTMLALGRKMGLHAFRYLIATWAKRLGLAVEDTADILGHLPQTTQGIYDMTIAQDTGRRTNASIKRLFPKRSA